MARIVFMDVRSARNCIESYNRKSVMGKELNVFHDAFGARCKQLFEEITTGKKPNMSAQPLLINQPLLPPPLPQQQHILPTFGKDDSILHHSEHDFHAVASNYIDPYKQGAHSSIDIKGMLNFIFVTTHQNFLIKFKLF